MLRVLLNVTDKELEEPSGDMVLLRNLSDCARASGAPVQYSLLPRGGLLERDLRRVFWHLSAHWQPRALRRRLFLSSQRNTVPLRAVPDGVDLVQTHLFLPWNIAEVRKRWPVVYSSEGLSPPEYYRHVGRGLHEDVVEHYRRVGEEVDRIIVFTRACARRLVRACPGLAPLVESVPPVLPVEPAPGQPLRGSKARGTRFLFMAKDPLRKGLREVVRAFRAASRKDGEMELVVRSTGVPGDLAREMAGTERLAFHNEVWTRRRCVEELWKCDVYLLPTHAETFGAALVEAMARRSAVIASDIEPLGEIAPDGEVGFLVPPGDSPALAEKMLALSSSRERLEGMQSAARRHYERTYSPEAVFPKLIEAYRRAMEHHGRAR